MVKINYVHEVLLSELKVSKFHYFAAEKTTQHSLKSTQYTFKHCTEIFECFEDGRMMWFCMRGPQICLIKWCVK